MKTGKVITFNFTDLSKPEQDKLRDFLNQPQAAILIKVVKSLVIKEVGEAINKASEGGPANNQLEAANVHVVKGQRYKHFLDVWDEISGNTGNHQTAQLT